MKWSEIKIYFYIQVRETTETLGRRIQQLEVAIEGEIKERELVTKQLKKAEKALGEATVELEDTKENSESYKSQVSRSTTKGVI